MPTPRGRRDIPFVAVSFGFSDRPVAELGADAVIDSYAELVSTLERLGDPLSPAGRGPG